MKKNMFGVIIDNKLVNSKKKTRFQNDNKIPTQLLSYKMNVLLKNIERNE